MIYVCSVFWGAAIVLFLLDWIPTGSKDRQSFWVEVSSQVENGVFSLSILFNGGIYDKIRAIYSYRNWATSLENC